MNIKILQGTRSAAAPRLCDTCMWSVITRGPSESQEQIYCRRTERSVRMRIVECSEFVSRALPSLYDMRQIAWVLQTDSGRQRIGFLKSSEWRKRNPDEDLIPDF